MILRDTINNNNIHTYKINYRTRTDLIWHIVFRRADISVPVPVAARSKA